MTVEMIIVILWLLSAIPLLQKLVENSEDISLKIFAIAYIIILISAPILWIRGFWKEWKDDEAV